MSDEPQAPQRCALTQRCQLLLGQELTRGNAAERGSTRGGSLT
jgi:hypothetical protein